MKKIIGAVATVMLASTSFVVALDKPLVSIDSIMIMQKSQEGQELGKKIQKEIEKFQSEVKNSQKELAEMQEAINKQADVLKTESKQEKVDSLAQKRKKLEREFADKEEQLRMNIQKRQMALRESQLKVIKRVFEQEKWGALFDINTPGLLAHDPSTEKTELVLAEVDKQFLATKKLAGKQTVKTAANTTASKSSAATNTVKGA